MISTELLAAESASEHRSVTLALFAVVVASTLLITIWAARHRKTRDEFFTAGGSLTGRQNGLAMAGDSLSASAVLGSVGLVSLFGYDGFMFGIANAVAFAVLLLVAGFLRNVGRFTVADVVATRARERPVRLAAAFSSLTISGLFLVAQMVGTGALVSMLLGDRSTIVANAPIRL